MLRRSGKFCRVSMIRFLSVAHIRTVNSYERFLLKKRIIISPFLKPYNQPIEMLLCSNIKQIHFVRTHFSTISIFIRLGYFKLKPYFYFDFESSLKSIKLFMIVILISHCSGNCIKKVMVSLITRILHPAYIVILSM